MLERRVSNLALRVACAYGLEPLGPIYRAALIGAMRQRWLWGGVGLVLGFLLGMAH
jgi:hypothetical protein